MVDGLIDNGPSPEEIEALSVIDTIDRERGNTVKRKEIIQSSQLN